MGVPPFMITATVEAILAQRLVRRICVHCREEIEVTDRVLAQISMTRDEFGDRAFYRGKGCDACNNTGYRGRVGLFELMIMNEELREMILHGATNEEMRDVARGYGMVSLRDAGMEFAFDGVTTIDEVIRETILEA
jgi:type IV pilus assembly protein PilB